MKALLKISLFVGPHIALTLAALLAGALLDLAGVLSPVTTFILQGGSEMEHGPILTIGAWAALIFIVSMAGNGLVWLLNEAKNRHAKKKQEEMELIQRTQRVACFYISSKDGEIRRERHTNIKSYSAFFSNGNLSVRVEFNNKLSPGYIEANSSQSGVIIKQNSFTDRGASIEVQGYNMSGELYITFNPRADDFDPVQISPSTIRAGELNTMGLAFTTKGELE